MEVIHPNPRNSRISFFHSIFAFSSFARHGYMNLTLLGCSILQHMFRAYRWLLVFEHFEVEVLSSSLVPTLVMVPLHTGPTVSSVCHFRWNCVQSLLSPCSYLGITGRSHCEPTVGCMCRLGVTDVVCSLPCRG